MVNNIIQLLENNNKKKHSIFFFWVQHYSTSRKVRSKTQQPPKMSPTHYVNCEVGKGK